MVKIELESIASNLSVNRFDLSELEPSLEDLADRQKTNSNNEAEEQTELTGSLTQHADEVGEVEANRDEPAQQDVEAVSHTEDDTGGSIPQTELFNSDYRIVEPVETVSSLHEDDITSDVMDQEEILSEVASDGITEPQVEVGLQRKPKVVVRFVYHGLDSIEDIQKAKGKKRERGHK